MASRSRGRSAKVRSRRIDRSCSPYSPSRRRHPRYCDCDECYYLDDEPGFRVPEWLSLSTVFNSGTWTPILSLCLFFVLMRILAVSFPFGLFKSTAYGFEMGSVGSRVLFTLQQHIWSMIPLIFGSHSGTVTYTLHLVLNTVVISTFLSEQYMKYIASTIITSTIYALLTKYVESPDWRFFWSFPRRVINVSLTVLCIKYAMDTKTLTGLGASE